MRLGQVGAKYVDFFVLTVEFRNFCLSVGLFMCGMGTEDPQSRILHLISRLSSTYNFVWKCILENISGGEKTRQILHKKRFLQILSNSSHNHFLWYQRQGSFLSR